MRDVIWTIIIIWVVYKLVDIFRSASVVKKTFTFTKNETHYHNTQQKPEGSVTVEKNSKQGKTPKHSSTDGEYIDFEEIK